MPARRAPARTHTARARSSASRGRAQPPPPSAPGETPGAPLQHLQHRTTLSQAAGRPIGGAPRGPCPLDCAFAPRAAANSRRPTPRQTSDSRVWGSFTHGRAGGGPGAAAAALGVQKGPTHRVWPGRPAGRGVPRGMRNTGACLHKGPRPPRRRRFLWLWVGGALRVKGTVVRGASRSAGLLLGWGGCCCTPLERARAARNAHAPKASPLPLADGKTHGCGGC
jgi:hypothetical protein